MHGRAAAGSAKGRRLGATAQPCSPRVSGTQSPWHRPSHIAQVCRSPAPLRSRHCCWCLALTLETRHVPKWECSHAPQQGYQLTSWIPTNRLCSEKQPMSSVGVSLPGFGPVASPLARAFLVQADVNPWEISSHLQPSLESLGSPLKPRMAEVGWDWAGWNGMDRQTDTQPFCWPFARGCHTSALLYPPEGCKLCQGRPAFRRTSTSFRDSQWLGLSCPDTHS